MLHVRTASGGGSDTPQKKNLFVGGQSIPSPLRRHVPWFTDLLNGEYPTEDSYLVGDGSDMAACCQYCSNLFFFVLSISANRWKLRVKGGNCAALPTILLPAENCRPYGQTSKDDVF